MNENDFLTEEQKEYLAGFTVGAGLVSTDGAMIPVTASTKESRPPASASGPDQLLFAAHQRTIEAGGKLVNEEVAKAERHPLDRWDELVQRATEEKFPSGVDVFLTKSFGMFYVAPAQNSYMCRLRLAGGRLTSPLVLQISLTHALVVMRISPRGRIFSCERFPYQNRQRFYRLSAIWASIHAGLVQITFAI